MCESPIAMKVCSQSTLRHARTHAASPCMPSLRIVKDTSAAKSMSKSAARQRYSQRSALSDEDLRDETYSSCISRHVISHRMHWSEDRFMTKPIRAWEHSSQISLIYEQPCEETLA